MNNLRQNIRKFFDLFIPDHPLDRLIITCLAIITIIIIFMIRYGFTEPEPPLDSVSMGEKILFTTDSIPGEAQWFKLVAASEYSQENYLEAVANYDLAADLGVSDPESLIYAANSRAELRGNPLRVAIAIPISEHPYIAQEMLRGVAMAQWEFNHESTFSSDLLEVMLFDNNIEDESKEQSNLELLYEKVIKDDSRFIGLIGFSTDDYPNNEEVLFNEFKKYAAQEIPLLSSYTVDFATKPEENPCEEGIDSDSQLLSMISEGEPQRSELLIQWIENALSEIRVNIYNRSKGEEPDKDVKLIVVNWLDGLYTQYYDQALESFEFESKIPEGGDPDDINLNVEIFSINKLDNLNDYEPKTSYKQFPERYLIKEGSPEEQSLSLEGIRDFLEDNTDGSQHVFVLLLAGKNNDVERSVFINAIASLNSEKSDGQFPIYYAYGDSDLFSSEVLIRSGFPAYLPIEDSRMNVVVPWAFPSLDSEDEGYSGDSEQRFSLFSNEFWDDHRINWRTLEYYSLTQLLTNATIDVVSDDSQVDRDSDPCIDTDECIDIEPLPSRADFSEQTEVYKLRDAIFNYLNDGVPSKYYPYLGCPAIVEVDESFGGPTSPRSSSPFNFIIGEQ